jgi:hypothetical protein
LRIETNLIIRFTANDDMNFLRWPSAKLRVLDISVAAISALLCVLLLAGSANAATASPTITVSPTAAPVGATITVTGAGLPPSTSLALQWGSTNATWLVTGNPPQVTGIKTATFQRVLGSAQSDASGSVTAQIVVPSDFGGQHFIQAFLPNGTALPPRATFTLEPSFHITPASGPAGTPISVAATGLSDSLYSTSYHLAWDNTYVGYMTALSSGGATNFTLYASGIPGTHYIDIYQGYPGPGYLNPQQGPPASETQSWFPPDIPFHAQFSVTPQQVTSQPASSSTAAFNVPGSAAFGSFALLAALAGGALFVSRKEPEEREAISKALAAVVIVVLVAVAGVGLYLATSQSAATSSTISTTQSSTAQTSTISTVGFTPVASVVRPHITVPVLNVATTGPRISVTPTITSVGDNITVNGQGFAANAQLPLLWSTRQGSNVAGYQLVNKALRTVTAGADGSFSFTMKVPPDLGGLHFIAAGNLTKNSNGTLFIQRSASLSTTQGPQGTTVSVIMHGVGWDFNTNIVAVDYDNSYIGYACGFNSGGNVTVTIVASGSPGIHTIDVYPSVWWGPSTFASQGVVEYRYPLLTPQDHPELMPSFHFTFLMTP